MKKILTKEIITFYIISCLISWPFMIWMQFYASSWNNISLPQPIKASLFMWGPGIAALLVWKFFREKQSENLDRYKLFTGGISLNILIYIIPMLIFIFIYIEQLSTNQIMFFITLYSIVGFLNIYGEELGWRGFLQPNLKFLKNSKRFFLIGLMWEFWHLPMRAGALENGANPLNIMFLSLGTILLTFLIGLFVEKTKSVSIAISLHAFMNSIFSLASISKIPQESLTPYFITILSFYILVFIFWDKIKSKKVL